VPAAGLAAARINVFRRYVVTRMAWLSDAELVVEDRVMVEA
jgi:hypothetical protein